MTAGRLTATDALRDLLAAWEREFISFFGGHERPAFEAVPEVVNARAVLDAPTAPAPHGAADEQAEGAK